MIDVSYFGWHIHSETHDLCGETSCPVSVGDFVIAHSQVLPGYTPPVSQRYHLNSLEEIVCAHVHAFWGRGNISIYASTYSRHIRNLV